jgi:hypothetical protein
VNFWAVLVKAVIETLLPLALEWLKKLLERSAPAVPPPLEDVAAVQDLFASARAKLTFLDRLRGRGGVLDRAERVAVRNARALVARAQGDGPEVVLSTSERDSIA